VRLSTFSILAAHAAQVIPVSWRSIARTVMAFVKTDYLKWPNAADSTPNKRSPLDLR
jgi:hypothetical protein